MSFLDHCDYIQWWCTNFRIVVGIVYIIMWILCHLETNTAQMFFFLVFYQPLLSQPAIDRLVPQFHAYLEQDDIWELLTETKRAKVWRNINNSQCYKIQGVIDTTPGTIMSLLFDVSQRPKWDKRTEEMRIIEFVGGYSRIIYAKSKPIWPCSARDMVRGSTASSFVHKFRSWVWCCFLYGGPYLIFRAVATVFVFYFVVTYELRQEDREWRDFEHHHQYWARRLSWCPLLCASRSWSCWTDTAKTSDWTRENALDSNRRYRSERRSPKGDR